MKTVQEVDKYKSMEGCVDTGIANHTVFLEFLKLVQSVPGCMHEAEVEKIKQKQMRDAVDMAIKVVFEEWNVFQGYDPEGYLACYEAEMKKRGVPENLMIAAFKRLISSDFKDEVQKLAKCHPKQWSDFADTFVCASSMDLEIEQRTSERQKQKGEGLRHNMSCVRLPMTIRDKLEAVVDECLMEDDQLLFKDDAEIVEAVYAKLELQEAIRDLQGLHNVRQDAVLQPEKDMLGEFSDFEDSGQDEDAIITAFLFDCDAYELDDVVGFFPEGTYSKGMQDVPLQCEDLELMALLDDALNGFLFSHENDNQEFYLLCKVKQEEEVVDDKLMQILDEALEGFIPIINIPQVPNDDVVDVGQVVVCLHTRTSHIRGGDNGSLSLIPMMGFSSSWMQVYNDQGGFLEHGVLLYGYGFQMPFDPGGTLVQFMLMHLYEHVLSFFSSRLRLMPFDPGGHVV